MTPDFELEGLRVTEEICADRLRRVNCQKNVDAFLTNAPSTTGPAESQTPSRFTQSEEAAIATAFATPQMRVLRPLISDLSFAQIDEIIARVRREVWRDLSTSD